MNNNKQSYKRKPLTLIEISKAVKERVASISKEFSDGFEFIKNYPRSVTIFGSARTNEDDIYYKKARNLAKKIVETLHYSIITGGGPGIMEASNRGAYEAGGNSLGLNIELPTEQENNKYLTDSIEFHYFFIRKVCMSFCAEAYIFFPGGFGTLDEFLEILTLVQTNKIRPVPIILFGKDFWNNFDELFKKLLISDNKIDKLDTTLYKITDDENEIIEIIKKTPVQIGMRYGEHEHNNKNNDPLAEGPISKLSEKHCIPCEGGVEPFSRETSEKFLTEINEWTLIEDKELEKTYEFKNFIEAMDFMNNIAKIAEEEGHHPDIKLHDYKKVTIHISTHAIGGLSENDFILASKIDDLLRK